MAGDPFRILASGEPLGSGVGPFNLDWHNAVSRAVKQSIDDHPPVLDSKATIGPEREFLIANVSGQVLDKHSIVGLGKFLALTYGHTTILSAAPAEADPFGVLIEPIPMGQQFTSLQNDNTGHVPPDAEWWEPVDPDDWDPAGVVYKFGATYATGDVVIVPAIGRARLAGAVRCIVDMSNLAHRFAVPIDDDYANLASASTGPAFIDVSGVPDDTQLDGAINDSVTEIAIDNIADWPDPAEVGDYVITIGAEDLLVTAKGDTLTVVRGHGSSSPASHADNATVAFTSGPVWAVVLLESMSGDSGCCDECACDDFELTGPNMADPDTWVEDEWTSPACESTVWIAVDAAGGMGYGPPEGEEGAYTNGGDGGRATGTVVLAPNTTLSLYLQATSIAAPTAVAVVKVEGVDVNGDPFEIYAESGQSAQFALPAFGGAAGGTGMTDLVTQPGNDGATPGVGVVGGDGEDPGGGGESHYGPSGGSPLAPTNGGYGRIRIKCLSRVLGVNGESGSVTLTGAHGTTITSGGNGKLIINPFGLDTAGVPTGYVITWTGSGFDLAAAADGDVDGPASSGDNEIPRFNGTTGKVLQGYTSGGPTISDIGEAAFATASNTATISAINTSNANGISALKGTHQGSGFGYGVSGGTTSSDNDAYGGYFTPASEAQAGLGATNIDLNGVSDPPDPPTGAAIRIWADEEDERFYYQDRSGNVFGPLGAETSIEAENKDGATVVAGSTVATHSSGTGFVRADGADPTLPCIGLLRADTADTMSGIVQTDGPFRLADWTAITGSASLNARAIYFLDPTTPGMLTTTVPTAAGQILQEVGVAVSTDTLELKLEPPVLL